MKKLMIMAAIASAAVVAQAAMSTFYLEFTAGEVYDGKGNESLLVNKSAYIFDAGTLSQRDFYNVLAAGGTVPTSYLAYPVEIGSEQTPGAMDLKYKFVTDSYTDGDEVEFYFAVIESSSKLVYFSTVSRVTLNTDMTEANPVSAEFYEADYSDIAPTKSGFNGEGYWSSYAAVPEPTSGVLMLLGLAGLALKRKRA